MGHKNFRLDIKIGEAGERVVAKDLIEMGFNFIRDNKNSDFDLLLEKDCKIHTFEVKTEDYVGSVKEMARQKRNKNNESNFFIEFESRDKPSGIKVTKAKKHAIHLPKIGEIWYISTKDLKELIENNDLPVVRGGDDGTSLGYLLHRHKFKDHFTIREI